MKRHSDTEPSGGPKRRRVDFHLPASSAGLVPLRTDAPGTLQQLRDWPAHGQDFEDHPFYTLWLKEDEHFRPAHDRFLGAGLVTKKAFDITQGLLRLPTLVWHRDGYLADEEGNRLSDAKALRTAKLLLQRGVLQLPTVVWKNGRLVDAAKGNGLSDAKALKIVKDGLRCQELAIWSWDEGWLYEEDGTPLSDDNMSALQSDDRLRCVILPDDHDIQPVGGRAQLGLVAATGIRKGDYITMYSRGMVVAQADEPEAEEPFGFEYSVTVSKNQDDNETTLLLQGNPLMSLGCMANMANERRVENRRPSNNADMIRVFLRRSDGWELHVALCAIRDISAGEDITLDYGKSWHNDDVREAHARRSEARRIADAALDATRRPQLLREQQLQEQQLELEQQQLEIKRQQLEIKQEQLLRAIERERLRRQQQQEENEQQQENERLKQQLEAKEKELQAKERLNQELWNRYKLFRTEADKLKQQLKAKEKEHQQELEAKEKQLQANERLNKGLWNRYKLFRTEADKLKQQLKAKEKEHQQELEAKEKQLQANERLNKGLWLFQTEADKENERLKQQLEAKQWALEEQLLHACKWGDPGYRVKVLLQAVGSRWKDVEDEDQRTLLATAALCGRLPAVKELLEKGADIEVVDRDGNTPLLLACVYRNAGAVVGELLAAGADKEARDSEKRTPLMRAALNGNFVAVERLLSAGADRTAQDDQGRTAVSLAVMCGHVETLQLLLKAGCDAAHRDRAGDTPLQLAIKANKTWVVECLRAHGVTDDNNA